VGNKTGKTIHHETGIVESGVSKHLNALRITGIVEYVTCTPRDGKKYTGDILPATSSGASFLIH
jgi:hypothetical protein